MENNIYKLTTDDNNKCISKDMSIGLDTSKQKIKQICEQIVTLQDECFDNIITRIEEYLDLTENRKRILYSEISNYIFELDDKKCGTFLTNIDKLLGFVLSKKEKKYEELSKLIIKIYDHCNLAEKQKSMS